MDIKSSYYVNLVNLLELSHILDNEVTDILKERFLKGEFYTWAGPSLIAINPCQNITRLYTDEMKIYYRNIWEDHELDQMKPHIYAVASKAKYNMIKKIGKVNQAIVLTGESGSGKTCSASHLLDLLVYPNTKTSGGSHSLTTLCQRANLILKAFGNAHTVFNKDSSRFGKLLSMYWTNDDYSTSKLLGAHIEIYLLEKTRVTNSNTSSGQNFHIFYQVLSGLSDDEANTLHFPVSRDFRIANYINPFLDKIGYCDTVNAIEEIGISQQDWKSILCILGAILHLGNVDFQNDNEDICSLNSNAASINGMYNGCKLLEVEEDLFAKLLTSKLIVTNMYHGKARNKDFVKTIGLGDSNGLLEDNSAEKFRSHARYKLTGRSSIFRKPCSTPHECSSRKDSVLRYLYQNLFQWVLKQVNTTLSSQMTDNRNVIGILDIFGFEDFENNSLEQLCINYTNERVHQFYVKNYFIDYQKMLEEEGFSKSEKDIFCNNLSRLELFESIPSIFGILNDESIMNRRNPDENFFRRVEVNIHSPYLLASTTKQGLEFIVGHYAGKVCYNASGMVFKNADKVPEEIVEFLTLSNNIFLKKMLYQKDYRANSKQTLLAKFMESLNSLTKTLDEKDIHYVRCLKAHPSLLPQTVDFVYFQRQLQYAGIIDLINLKQKAFPIRMKYAEFLERYKILTNYDKLLKEITKSNNVSLQSNRNSQREELECETNCRNDCKEILSKVQEKENMNVLWGKSSLIFGESLLSSLEIKKKAIYDKAASIIQTCWNKYRFSSNKRRHMKGLLTLHSSRDETYLGTKSSHSNAGSIHFKEKTNQKCILRFVHFGDGIISKQEIPKIAVRFYTKHTCIPYSQCIPVMLKPKGLPDAFFHN